MMDEIYDFLEDYLDDLNADSSVQVDDGRRLVIHSTLPKQYRLELQDELYDNFDRVSVLVQQNYGGGRFITEIIVQS